MTIALACRLLHAAAAVFAVALARRHRGYRPIAWLLALSCLADFTRWGLGRWLDTQPVPHTGLGRLGHHLDQALFIAWPVGIAAVCWHVYLRRVPRPHALAYVVVLAMLVIGYPWPLRGDVMRWVYAAIHATAFIASLACAVAWAAQIARMRPGREGTKPPEVDHQTVEVEHKSALLIVAAEAALFAGPLFPVSPDPFRRWQLAQGSYALLYLMLVLIQMKALLLRQTGKGAMGA